MKATTAANLALGLLVVGWSVATLGVFWSLGDPDPRIPVSVIENHRHFVSALLWIGILSLLSSLWLSGYSFKDARRRASLVVVLDVLPVLAIFVYLFLASS